MKLYEFAPSPSARRVTIFAKEIGGFYYNRGLSDAQLLLTEKVEEIGYLIQEMEKPTH